MLVIGVMRMKNEELNIIDRFLYKLLICSFLLFAVVIFDKINLIKIENARQPFAEHANILPFIQKINKEGILIPWKSPIRYPLPLPDLPKFANHHQRKVGHLE